MKILYITPRYYPHIGGVEYVVKAIAERLAKQGHDVTVLTGEPNIEHVKEEIINKVKVIRWPTWAPKEAYHIPRFTNRLEKLLSEFARYVNVVHIHGAHAVITVVAGLRIHKYLRNAKLVFAPHYHGKGHTFLRNLLWIYWRRKVSTLVRHATLVQAVSKREASLILTHYPQACNKIVIIPNGVDEDVLNYRWRGQDSDYMIYAGRVEKYKRLELAINIAKSMGLKLLIVGKGAHRVPLKKYANKVYKGGVEFLDPQSREKYLELLSRARYAINPSKHEAFSIFIAEAVAMRVPAMVSKEIAENLEAEVKPFKQDLVIITKSCIKTWNEIVKLYLDELYG